MEYRFITGERYAFEPVVTSLETSHTSYCWGCGPKSEYGIGPRPEIDGTLVHVSLEFERRFEGGPGTVHGGAVAALMDDLLGHVPYVYGSPGVTAKLEMNYISPVPVDVMVSGEAWMSNIDGRKMFTEGVILYEESVLVEASALLLSIDFDHYQNIFDSFTDEHKERLAAYRSGDYYP